MISTPTFFILALLSALSAGCSDADLPAEPGSEAVVLETSVIPYDLDQPHAAFALPRELLEISGLTIVDGTHLGAVQDEQGIVFVLERETAQIVRRGRFLRNGDFEGIATVENDTWVLMSDGTLYKLAETVDDEVDFGCYDLNLHGSCDAEGLALEAARHRLLIACKENPGRGLGSVRALYAFDLSTEEMTEAPVYLIDRQGLDRQRDVFKPSAIAIHPRSGFLYVLSSVRKVLVVIDPEHPEQLVEARELPEELFQQPEGLAFFPDGTMFIANEGVNGPATLLRFDEQTDTR